MPGNIHPAKDRQCLSYSAAFPAPEKPLSPRTSPRRLDPAPFCIDTALASPAQAVSMITNQFLPRGEGVISEQ